MGAGLGEVHEQIFSVGEEEARRLTGSKAERFCHDIATGILRDDKFDLSILHSGFAVTALPHRATQAQVWTRTGGKNGELTLEVQSGRFNGESLGIPYGPSARLILIYLCSEAVTNKSRVVELGASMNAFLRRMGVGAGGKTRSIFRDQSRRLSACRLTFFYRRAHDTVISNGSFVRNAVFVNAGGPHDQSSLWSDTVELDEAFYKSLTDHPLPLREAAIRQLSGRSMALDGARCLCVSQLPPSRPGKGCPCAVAGPVPAVWRRLQLATGLPAGIQGNHQAVAGGLPRSQGGDGWGQPRVGPPPQPKPGAEDPPHVHQASSHLIVQGQAAPPGCLEDAPPRTHRGCYFF